MGVKIENMGVENNGGEAFHNGDNVRLLNIMTSVVCRLLSRFDWDLVRY